MKRPNYVFDDELYHHGILGQKWGNRRFQNEDGSWTPEGRERYGKGDEKIEAKAKYDTQKYKADLRSKAKINKDTRSANEERNRIKQQAKTDKLLRKEQRKIIKEEKRNKKTMSSDELKEAIDRLNLQIEYNKKLALASNPNSALAKADRFFEGPTGRVVGQIAVNTIPDLVKTSASKMLDYNLTKKIAAENKDPEKSVLEKAEKLANIRKANANASFFEAQAREKLSSISKSSSNETKISSNETNNNLIKLPPAYPNAPRSSDIPKTTPVETSTIGKTVRPDNYGAPGTISGRRLYAWEANELNRKKKKS